MSKEYRLEKKKMSCVLQPVLYSSWLFCTKVFSDTVCSLLSKNSSGINPTMCYRRLFKNLDNLITRKFLLMCNLNFSFVSSCCTLFPLHEPSLNTFPCKYFPSFEYPSATWSFLMLLRLVEVLLTSDSSSTCQVLNCFEFTVFSSVCQGACIVAPRTVLLQCGTTISLGYDMANIPLHNI